jgi:hypothetical protein
MKNNDWLRAIPGYPGYFAGNDGSIWGPDRRGGLVKKQLSPTTKGYLSTSLTADGRTSTHLVHRLVLLAFVGPQPDGTEGKHRDLDRTNNGADNLYWGPVSGDDGSGRRSESVRGEQNGRSKLDDKKVEEILNLSFISGVPSVRVAKMYGVSTFTVNAIVRGTAWGHVPRPVRLAPPNRGGRPRLATAPSPDTD